MLRKSRLPDAVVTTAALLSGLAQPQNLTDHGKAGASSTTAIILNESHEESIHFISDRYLEIKIQPCFLRRFHDL